jgi:hypothetical protein
MGKVFRGVALHSVLPCRVFNCTRLEGFRARPLATSSGPYTIVIRVQIRTLFN